MRRFFIVKDQDGVVLRRQETTFRGDLQAFAGPGETAEEVDELPPAPVLDVEVTRADVNTFARRLLGYTDWYVMRAQDPEGKPVPQAIWDYRAAVRARAGEIGAMEPIPADYQAPSYWPDQV